MNPNKYVFRIWWNGSHKCIFIVGWNILISNIHADSPWCFIHVFFHGFPVNLSCTCRCVILVKSRSHASYGLIAIANGRECKHKDKQDKYNCKRNGNLKGF